MNTKQRLFTTLGKWLSQINPNLFLAYGNIVYRTAGSEVSLRFDKSSKLYYAEDASSRIYVCTPVRAFRYINGLRRSLNRLLNVYLVDTLDFPDGSVVLDVGANIGEVALALNGLGKQCFYYGFEPSRLEFSALEKNLGDVPNCIIHQTALWRDCESIKFYEFTDSADGTLIDGVPGSCPVIVNAITVDSLNLNSVYLIKIDAEGAEPEVFEGAQKTLRKTRYVAADVGYERGFRKQSTLKEVCNNLFALGFIIKDFDSKSGRVRVLFENNSI